MLRIYTINSSTHNERPKLSTGVPSGTCHCRKSGFGRGKHLRRDCVTHSLHSSSFLGLPYRILDINHKKELLWSLIMGKPKVYTIGGHGPPGVYDPNSKPLVPRDA